MNWKLHLAIASLLIIASPKLLHGKEKRSEIKKFPKGKMKDSRDGTIYNTVTINGKKWMSENLDYKMDGSVCYENSKSNCAKYGRLYDAKTAMAACPDQWHLPSDSEWIELMEYVDNDMLGLMSREMRGTDLYGFKVLPAGIQYYSGKFMRLGEISDFWSSTSDEYGSSAWEASFSPNYPADRHTLEAKATRLSVRCVAN